MIEFDEAWNQKHDPQRQTPAGFCQRCGGEIYDFETLCTCDGMCPECWWAENGDSWTGDPSPTEMLAEYDGENSGCHVRATIGRRYGDEGRTGNARPYEDGGEGD